jgi:hypothetical protein
MRRYSAITILAICGLYGHILAKVDLVTLPNREATQLTIYNSADLTLVRDARSLTMKEGLNQLQFSWANTLIDPTSLEMLPKANADKIDIFDLTYPPRVKNLGLWNINSGVSGKVPVEITYLTSGISWRAFYMGTLSPDEKTMQLQGYVRVTNNSGEDYENAQTRLIVGKVHLLDQIAQLAQRSHPYGSPGLAPLSQIISEDESSKVRRLFVTKGIDGGVGGGWEEKLRTKEIVKEGLSEYFLYTIEGTESIPTGWSKRLPSFDVADVPVVNLYKFEQDRYGDLPVRYLSFKNSETDRLGETPIPGGMLKVYRSVDSQQRLSYQGQSSFKYIPIDQDVELELGPVKDVIVEPTLMEKRTENYSYDRYGNISGWDEVSTFRIKARSARDLAVKVEIRRNFNTNYWELRYSGDCGEYEKKDTNTVKFTLELAPHSEKVFGYVLTTYQGARQQER